MNGTFQVEPAVLAEFNREFDRYLKVTSRTVEEAVNIKMLFVARRAMSATPVKPRHEIEAALNVTGYHLNRGKKGRIMKGRRARGDAMFGDSLIYRIINAQRARRGKPGLYGERMRAASQGLLKRRMKGSGTLKAGFVNIIRVFARRCKEAAGMEDVARVKGSGIGKPAEVSEKNFKLDAEATYRVEAKTGRAPQRFIHPSVEKAINAAFAEEARDMAGYIEDKLRPVLKP